MMDLAEIRKKARAQKEPVSENPVFDEPVSDSSLQRQDVLEADEFSESTPFWQSIGSEQFATEEEYAQGLSLETVEESLDQVRWLGFYLGEEEYAIDLEVVSELIKPRALTELPQVPSYVCGIISLRGEVIPIIDLKSRLGLRTGDHCDLDLQRIVVCEGDEQRVGLLVDRISQVVRIPREEIEVPQLVGDEPSAAFIKGVGRSQGRMMIQLRPEKALEIESGTPSGTV